MHFLHVCQPVLAFEKCFVWAKAARLRQQWIQTLRPLLHGDIRLRPSALPIIDIALEGVVQIVEGVAARVVPVVPCSVSAPMPLETLVDATPAVFDATPADATPAVVDAAPAVNDAAPAVFDAVPVDVDAAPAVGVPRSAT